MTGGLLQHGLCHKNKALVAFLQDNLRQQDILPIYATDLVLAETNWRKYFLLGPDKPGPDQIRY